MSHDPPIEYPGSSEIQAAEDAELINVCDACLMASCWRGIFMCQQAQHAGITQRTRAELKKLNREHPCYWNTDEKEAT